MILYNCDSWSVPSDVIESLDVTHRKHLRRVLNVYWPNGTISNTELYRRCNSNTTKLSYRISKRRWTMFGHILRSKPNTPAFLSLKYAISNTHKSRIGRHQSNLFNVLIKDLKSRNYNLNNLNDLNMLRNVAIERNQWRKLF